MRMRPTHRFRHTIAVISILAGFVSACVWIVNRPEVLAHALSIANARSDWNIRVQRVNWKPLSSSIRMMGMSTVHRPTGKSFRADEVDISYRLLGLLRGRFVIDELVLRGTDIVLPPAQGPRGVKPRRRIDPARFLILKHFELVEGRVEGLDLAFGKDARLSADELRLSLIPSIFGDSRLAIRTDGIKLDKADRQILTAGFISLKTSTRVERWVSAFPYVNSFKGSLGIQDANVEGASFDSIRADVSLEDELLSLEELDITVGGRRLLGTATANLDDQSFDLAIDISKPISLPHIGKPIQTIDTGGELSGRIRLKGKGFVPSRTEGSGQADLTHRFQASPEFPVRVLADVSWRNGVFSLPAAVVAVGDDMVRASGTIDVPGRRMEINGSGERFPVEHLFDKFNNRHLARIFGRSDFTASITGWGKGFKAHVEGVTYDGGWTPIKAQKIITVLDATYDDLVLSGKAIQDDAQVGEADLAVKFGAKMADGKRFKDIDLTASMTDIDLAYPMEAFRLSGKGNGTITIKGPHTNFKGVAKARIDDGKFLGLSFDHASTELDISRMHIDFKDIRLALPKTEVSEFSGILQADFSPGRMRLHGTPLEGFDVDAYYDYDPKRWSIRQFSWKDPERPGDMLDVSGTLVSGGPLDLRANGKFDAALLSVVTAYVRDNRGPMELDLSIRGTTADPRFYGKIGFDKASLTLRDPRVEVDSLSGVMRFDGNRVSFEDIVAVIEDGSARLSGYFEHREMRPSSVDLSLEAKAMRYRSREGAFNLELDGNLALKGPFPQPVLSGDVTIVDGRYTKDFTIVDVFTAKERAAKRKKAISEEGVEFFDPRLAVRIRSSGDMEIKNNVGEIFLNVNVEIVGSRSKPEVTGSINTSEGYVDYLGLDFDITKGFIEFRGEGDTPYLEVHAQKEVRVYNVTLTLYGPIDNLKMDLSATSPHGPLDKHDVVSLLFFGATDEEREEMQRSSGQFGTSMAAAGVGGVLGGPITRFAHIDTFKLEAADPESTGISRVQVGKEVSDRLTVSFASDIGVDNAVQSFAAEYLITDNVLIKGQRSTDSKYELSGILRFRLR